MWSPAGRLGGPSTSVSTDDLESNGIFEKVEQRIANIEKGRALREPPWDGFCGLVKISDDETFKEQGYIGPPQPSETFSVQGKGLSDPAGRSRDSSRAAEGSSSKAATGEAGPAADGEGAEPPSLDSEFPDEFLQFTSETEGGEEEEGASPLPHDHTARRRIASSISGAGKTVAASITGASSRISSTLSGGFHAAAEEAARLKGYLASRGPSDRGEEEEQQEQEEDPEGREGHEQHHDASSDSTPQATTTSGPPSSPLTARIKTWAGGISHGSGGLAVRLNRQLAAVLQQHPEHHPQLRPHDAARSAAAAEEQGDEVRRRRSATAIANEAFKAAAAALEDGRPAEAKELAEVALKGIPDSKPRALKKVQNLQAQAAALLSQGHHSNSQAPPVAPDAPAGGCPSRFSEESTREGATAGGSSNAGDARQRGPQCGGSSNGATG